MNGDDVRRSGPKLQRNAICVGSLMFAVGITCACATFGHKHLDYTGLASADRLEVSSTNSRDSPIATITDRSKVQYAVDFILRRQDRWGDHVNPWVPSLVLRFYARGRDLGGYGVGSEILVLSPSNTASGGETLLLVRSTLS